MLLACAISAANVNDDQALQPLVRGLPAVRSRRGPHRHRPAKLHGDKAYHSRDQRRWLPERQIRVRIARPGQRPALVTGGRGRRRPRPGHGRRETRTVRVLQYPGHLNLGLAGTTQVIKIGRHVLRKKTVTAELAWTREFAYLLTNLPAHLAGPAVLGEIVRSACLRNTAISRHRLTGADNIRKRLRACARDTRRAIDALTAGKPQDQL